MPDADSHASEVTVHTSQDGATATVTVAGELDISSVEWVEQALPDVEPGGRLVLVADLLRLTRIADRVRVVDDPDELA